MTVVHCRWRFGLCILTLASAVATPCWAGKPSSRPTEPEWVASGKQVKMSDVPKSDYPYLARWVDDHAQAPEDYVIGLFKKHDVVILGENHNVREHKEFLIRLIPRLYHEAGVRCIGWEFSSYSENARLASLLQAKEFDRQAALEFARDALDHTWNSKEHWDLIEVVWRFNQSLPTVQEPLRFVGLACDDLLKLQTEVARHFIKDDSGFHLRPSSSLVRGSPEFNELINRHDATMASSIEKEMLAKHQKGLVFVGRNHEYTHYQLAPDQFLGRQIMGHILYEKYGERVFSVWLQGVRALPLVEDVMAMRGGKPAGFELASSPFANLLAADYFNAPLKSIARGFVYLGAHNKLHRNTPIKGFFTDAMLEQYRGYYAAEEERAFKSGQELDEYYQKRRWPQP